MSLPLSLQCYESVYLQETWVATEYCPIALRAQLREYVAGWSREDGLICEENSESLVR